VFYVCANFGENQSRIATRRVSTDGYTDAQMQAGFIICPMLYAVVMGQIKCLLTFMFILLFYHLSSIIYHHFYHLCIVVCCMFVRLLPERRIKIYICTFANLSAGVELVYRVQCVVVGQVEQSNRQHAENVVGVHAQHGGAGQTA